MEGLLSTGPTPSSYIYDHRPHEHIVYYTAALCTVLSYTALHCRREAREVADLSSAILCRLTEVNTEATRWLDCTAHWENTAGQLWTALSSPVQLCPVLYSFVKSCTALSIYVKQCPVMSKYTLLDCFIRSCTAVSIHVQLCLFLYSCV